MPNSAAKRSMVIGVLRVLIVIIAICCLGLQFSAIAASAGVAPSMPTLTRCIGCMPLPQC